MTWIRSVHRAGVHSRRVRVLAGHLKELIPQRATVLDVGSGDGLLASLVLAQRSDLTLHAVDTVARRRTHVPVKIFDGQHLPFADKSVDELLLIDVLHHTDDPVAMLRESMRVARTALIVKDHLRQGLAANSVLKFMDWVGNAGWGVELPYRYWKVEQWMKAREELGLAPAEERVVLGLYPWWADWLFGRSLHFIGRYRIPVG